MNENKWKSNRGLKIGLTVISLLTAAVVFFREWLGEETWTAVPVIAAAVLIYFGSLVLQKNELMMELAEKLKRRK